MSNSNSQPIACAVASDLIEQDMQRVERRLREQFSSDVQLIDELSQYIFDGGGKRLRPNLALLSARALGYLGESHIDVAVIVEMIHTATLLHDDVVDNSSLRRGRSVAHSIWGTGASILVGDFVYTRAFELMVALDNMRIMSILASTTNAIAEGEIRQLMSIGNLAVDEQACLEIIRTKTACLFSAACQIGAVLAGGSEAQERAMAAYGMHFGLAFQMIDDVLDYRLQTAVAGKNRGDDLMESKPTLPFVLALERAQDSEKKMLTQALVDKDATKIDLVCEVIERTGVFDLVIARAKQEIATAIEQLQCCDDSPHSAELRVLAENSLSRVS